jgi:hypothetical protein
MEDKDVMKGFVAVIPCGPNTHVFLKVHATCSRMFMVL